MSGDIRSFFKPLKKVNSNTSSSAPAKKKAKVLSDSDEDIIFDTPERTKHKKRPANVIISSDSESDSQEKKKTKHNSTNKNDTKKEAKSSSSSKLKPVSMSSAFGNKPIKQSKVEYVPKETIEKPPTEIKTKSDKKPKSKKKKKGEIDVHESDDFEKTLLDLDDDILIDNLDLFDKTIDEALAKEKEDKKTDKEEANKESSSIKENNIAKKNLNSSEPNPTSSNKNHDDTPRKSEAKKRSRKDSNASDHVDTPNKKTKLQHTDSGMDPGEEAYEKKRYSALLYQKYLNRSGPKHHGMKEIPKGKPDCLKNLCFLRTGVLDSLESEEFDELIQSHGGRTVHSVSKKVNYVVVGDDPGPAKLAKAENYNIPTLTEDELLDMIRVKSGMKTSEHAKPKSEASEDLGIESDVGSEISKSKSPTKSHSEIKKETKTPKIEKFDNKIKKEKHSDKPDLKKLCGKSSDYSNEIKDKKVSPKKDNTEKPKIEKSVDFKPIEKKSVVVEESNICWTEKYKPQDIKGIIGQQGENSNMKKLIKWLENWHKHHGKKNPNVKLIKPSPWAKSDDGSYFKCALLSGPPGVGKTTTATLVAKELGLDIVEFNASDTRSKKLLHEEVSQVLSSKTLANFVPGQATISKNRVLLMDEVDGMAGNEDRGGMQELINLIKNTHIPIICMCNDRNHQKVRSLANYCFDLKFSKPRPEQLKGAMMSVCYKAGVKISSNALSEIITGTNCDIRQTLNNLSMWSGDSKNITVEIAEKESKAAVKDTVLGPWEVCRKVFTESEHKNMTLMDKTRLFFYDYSLGPLFVQENYLSVEPNTKSRNMCLKRMAAAADAISMGDLIDSKIRRSNNWSLLEVQAIFSSVLPGYYMRGNFRHQINFPSWLGKNSKKTRYNRILSELQTHTRIMTSASKMAIKLDYLIPLRNAILRPLKQGMAGVDTAVEIMKTYNLLREDFDNIIELSSWSKLKKASALSADIDSKVKAAFTRTYNKKVALLPYAAAAGVSKKKASATTEDDFLNEEDAAALESDPENDTVDNDAMIKVKNKTAKGDKGKEASSSKKSESKGKGRGKKNK